MTRPPHSAIHRARTRHALGNLIGTLLILALAVGFAWVGGR
jgi:hypothetical protein